MNNSPINVNANINVDVNEITKPVLEPTLQSIGSVISDVFEIVFGKLHTFSEKRKILREKELSSFREEINTKISAIPIDKLKEPDIAIIGPVLEASKYYFENYEIRELFENLLVSSINIDYEACLHHAFCEIIKQLSTDEAILLDYLAKNSENKHKRFPVISIRYIVYNDTVVNNGSNNGIFLKRFTKENKKYNSHLYKIKYSYKDFKEGYTILKHISLDALHANCNKPQNIPKYFENLNRLGIIEFVDKILLENHSYKDIIQSNFVDDMILSNKYFENSHITLSHKLDFIFKLNYYQFTEFGCDFIKACIL